ncbi:fibronectin type III domain-containing protein [Flavobacterium phycosphaerae]|uniref:fibronectin type III domain-containing protein n=1 Tax=Flavobacterium phycosphaerae TaxID=2697515 RepID=UPI00138B1341|nr:fibronectin type III domain-containing protein [Flavobacterium phycosphaerae]
MRKITLRRWHNLALLLFLLTYSFSSAQCIRTAAFGSGVSNNSGVAQTITTCAYGTEYSTVTGLLVGQNYLFSVQSGSAGGQGTHLFLTVTDLSDNVIQYGTSPLTITGITSDSVRLHYADDSSCAGAATCHNSQVKYLASCQAPTGVVASNITTTTATISWNVSDTPPANGYEYYYATTSTAPTASTTPSGSVAADILTADLSGLTIASNYYVWVRSVCSNSDTSTWSVVANFATACDLVTDFSENFDSAVAFPACWAKVGPLGASYVQASATTTSTPNNLYIYSGSAASQAVVAMKPVSNAGDATHRLRFRARGNFTAGDTVEVGYLTDPADATTFVSLQSFTTTSITVYDTFIAELGTAPGANQVLAFRHAGNLGYSILIDDVNWEVIPTCIEPTAVVISNVSTDAATVSWNAAVTDPANGYEYYVSTTNTAPTASTTPTGSVGAGITTVDLSSLPSATTHYVWVRSVCSVSDISIWTAVTSFTTLCNAVTDFTENFDSAVAFPTCWAKVGPLGTSYVQASATTTSTPNNLYIYSGSTASQAVVAMRPISNAGDATHRLRFRARGNFTAGDTVEVGYLTDPADATTFVPLQSFTTTSITVYDTFIAELGTDPGANQVLAFRHKGTLGYSILIDDVNWEPIPTCIEPTGLVVSNITQTSATIAWTASVTPPANGYEYYYATTNTAPTASTTPSGSVGADVLTVDLNGLASSSVYYFWVRSVCSVSDSSIWSIAGTFTTPCPASTVPYSQDFESATVPAVPTCTATQNLGPGNNWTVVSNPGYGFTSKTLRYAYSIPNAANTWFYTNGITLTAGTSYTISYKYGNNSTTYIENLKVAFGDSPIDSAMTNALADHPGITGGTTTSSALQGLVEFTPAVSGDYYFGFNAYSAADQFYLFVDDISIVETLATPGFESNKFTFYPNPVKDVLNIGYNKTIAKVAVYNILGQEVLAKTINADQSQITMSNLPKGTYLVKVTAEDGAVKTIKVIKE